MKKIIRLTESDLHRLVKESVHKILREMDETDPRLKYGIDRVNQIFDICEKHQKNWTPTVNHLDPEGIIIQKYYSDWISAVRRDYTARRRLFLDLNSDIFFGVDANGFDIIKNIFEKRYGK